MHKVFQISQKVIASWMQIACITKQKCLTWNKKKKKVACVTTRRQEMSGGMNKINVNIWMFH